MVESNLSHCLSNLTGFKEKSTEVFLMLKWNFLYCTLCPATDHHREDSRAVSFTLSPQVLTQADRTPLSTPLQAELSQLSQPHLTHTSSSPLAPPGPFTSHRQSCTGNTDRSPRCQAKGNNHAPRPAGNASQRGPGHHSPAWLHAHLAGVWSTCPH